MPSPPLRRDNVLWNIIKHLVEKKLHTLTSNQNLPYITNILTLTIIILKILLNLIFNYLRYVMYDLRCAAILKVYM